MDLDLPELEEEAGEAAGALSGLLGLLDRLPSAATSAASSVGGLAARALGVGSAFDESSVRFRKANGQFVAAGSTATTIGQQLAQKIPSALTKVGAAATEVGGVVVQALSGDVRGALSQLGAWAEQGIGKLQEKLASLGPYGQAAAAMLGVLTAAVSATVGTMLDLMGVAIKIAETKAGISAAFSALAGGQAAGAAVLATISKLGEQLPFATSQLRQWGQSLLAAGVPAEALESRIRAIAAAEALMKDAGGGGGSAAESLFKRLAESGAAAQTLISDIQKGGRRSALQLAQMGLSTKDLASALGMTEERFKSASLTADQLGNAISKALQAKGGGSLAAMMNSWPVIIDKARGGFMSLFGGLEKPVSALMQATRKLFAEFNAGSPIIRGLKPVVTAVFGELFSLATRAVTAIHKGFLMVAIAALTAYIALRPIIQTIGAILANVPILSLFKAGLLAIGVVVGVIVGAFLLAVAVVGTFVTAIVSAAAVLVDWIGQAASAGADFVAGLAQGISSGVGAVVDAVKGVASSALGAFTSAFGIKSPSRVMMKHGEDNIAGGAAIGIDKGGAKVDDAMARMGAEPPKGGRGGQRGGGRSITIGEVNYHGPASDFPIFREQFMALVEELDAEAPAFP